MIIVVVFGLPLLFFFIPHTNHYKTIGGNSKPLTIKSHYIMVSVITTPWYVPVVFCSPILLALIIALIVAIKMPDYNKKVN